MIKFLPHLSAMALAGLLWAGCAGFGQGLEAGLTGGPSTPPAAIAPSSAPLVTPSASAPASSSSSVSSPAASSAPAAASTVPAPASPAPNPNSGYGPGFYLGTALAFLLGYGAKTLQASPNPVLAAAGTLLNQVGPLLQQSVPASSHNIALAGLSNSTPSPTPPASEVPAPTPVVAPS
ncbi:MAG TPA: hypothetical protein VKW04_18190 [Planctomycetota bacterium]|nr:hypothetical protein [Planctomycetota bacterium]